MSRQSFGVDIIGAETGQPGRRVRLQVVRPPTAIALRRRAVVVFRDTILWSLDLDTDASLCRFLARMRACAIMRQSTIGGRR